MVESWEHFCISKKLIKANDHLKSSQKHCFGKFMFSLGTAREQSITTIPIILIWANVRSPLSKLSEVALSIHAGIKTTHHACNDRINSQRIRPSIHTVCGAEKVLSFFPNFFGDHGGVCDYPVIPHENDRP